MERGPFAHCPSVWSRSSHPSPSDCPIERVRGICSLAWARSSEGRGLRALPRPRGCADGPGPGPGASRSWRPGPGRSPAPAESTCADGKTTFPPRPFPGGNQSSLLFSMSLRSWPFVPRYLSLPGIRAAPRWLGEGRAVAKISHLKTTMEPFRPARVVPGLYFRAGGKGMFALLLFSRQN